MKNLNYLVKKNDIIIWLNDNKDFNDGFNKICTDDNFKGDLLQEFYLIILEKPEKELKKLYYSKSLVYWSLRVLKNQFHSKSSPFYKKYRVRKEDIEDMDLVENESDITKYEIIEDVERILDVDIHWFDAHLFRLYYLNNILEDGSELKPMSLRQIKDLHTYENLSISIGTITKSLSKTLLIVRKKLKEKYGMDGFI